MADDSTLVDAPRSSVFTVLADPPRYEQFVVGNSAVRRFDPRWPEDGSVFHHSLGIRPFLIKDVATSLGTDNATYLVLLTRMGFLGATITTFRLLTRPGGTEVEIREEPMWGMAAWMWTKLVDLVLAWRNRRLLARLKRLAEEQFARERSVLPSSSEPPAHDAPG
jgi:hypothetical protein